ncbi:MAG: CsgG/HfaB family protein [Gemmatimonas sp.]|nr:CsgG/HfaB family protein [Gemmatimonadaceae bacterium]
MRIARASLLTGILAINACAAAISASADNIARLESASASKPASEAAQRSLGIAYFHANRYADARTVLDRAASMDPHDGVVALYRGLTAEAQNDVPAARSAYESYLMYGKTRAVKKQIAERLVVIARKENELEAKRAVAQEQELASVPGSPRTVAVLPFKFTGADTSLTPLERGFAELVATDLSRSSQLTVVERARLQAILDEIRLQQIDGVQAGTGVRAGKILQAGRLVGGTISQLDSNQLRADAFVTNVQTTQTEGGGANDQQALDQLFTLEKNIVLRLFADLGVTLTTAERNAIEQRPTRSLAAFLAYSRGLEAEDEGRFDAASRLFDNALRLDPSFAPAQQHGQNAKSAAAGAQVTVSSVRSGLRGTSEGASVSAATQPGSASSADGQAFAIADGLNPSAAAGATGGRAAPTQPQKDPASGTGGDNVSTKTATITIVIHHP